MLRFLAVLLVLLAGSTVLTIVLLENPNQFKDQLGGAISANSDYEIEIEGDLSWRYWPPIAIQAENISFGRKGAPPLGRFETMEVDVDLMPLLTQTRLVDVNLILLDGGSLTLLVDAAGNSNWQTSSTGVAGTGSPGSASPTMDQPNIHKFQIQNSQISYVDQQTGDDYELNIESLQTTKLAIDVPFDVSLSASARDNTNNQSLTLTTTGQLAWRSTNRLSFDNIVISAEVRNADTSYPEVQVATNGEWHPERDVVIFNRADISMTSMQVYMTGLLNLSASPRFDGEFNFESADVRRLAASMGQDLPLQTLQLNTGIQASPDTIVMNTLDGRFDDTNFKGQLTITNGELPRLSGDLRLDRLVTAPYLESPQDAGATNTGASPAQDPANREVIPISLLRELALDTILRIDQLEHAGQQYTASKLELSSNTQVMDFIANTESYGGKLVVSIDSTLAPTVESLLKISVDRIDVTELSQVQSFTGTLTGHANLQFDGSALGEITESLVGKTVFTISDGTLDVRPLKQLAATIDTLRGKQSRISTWPDTMPFEHMNGQHVFNGGIERGQVFNSRLDNLKLTALGGFSINTETLDYQLTAMFESSDTGQFPVSDQLAGIRWPMTCSGPMSAAAADLCFGQEGAINDLVIDIAKQDIKRRGNRKIDEIIDEKIPDQLKELTRDLFKDIFK